MEEELEVELDAYNDFDELKPWWCEGLLQERTDKNGSTKFYVNLGRTCGCKATQTTKVVLHKKATIPLSERRTVAARKVLDKVRALTRPFRLFFSTPRLFLRSCLPLPSSLPPVFVSLFIVTSIELTHTPPCRPTPPPTSQLYMHEKGNENNENPKCDMEEEPPALPAVDRAADLRPRRRCDLLCELHGAAAHRQRGGDYGVEEQRWGLDVEAGQSGGGVRGGLL